MHHICRLRVIFFSAPICQRKSAFREFTMNENGKKRNVCAAHLKRTYIFLLSDDWCVAVGAPRARGGDAHFKFASLSPPQVFPSVLSSLRGLGIRSSSLATPPPMELSRPFQVICICRRASCCFGRRLLLTESSCQRPSDFKGDSRVSSIVVSNCDLQSPPAVS